MKKGLGSHWMHHAMLPAQINGTGVHSHHNPLLTGAGITTQGIQCESALEFTHCLQSKSNGKMYIARYT